MVTVLLRHGADINKTDVDSWTPLHAAAANGHSGKSLIVLNLARPDPQQIPSGVVRCLIEAGANSQILTEDGETARDLVESDDLETLAALLSTNIEKLRKKISVTVSTVGSVKSQPAWVRKESNQEELEKKKIEVMRAKKCNEISDGQKVKSKEKEISRNNDPVNSGKQERKRRNGQSDPLAYIVNSKLSQSDSKDRM